MPFIGPGVAQPVATPFMAPAAIGDRVNAADEGVSGKELKWWGSENGAAWCAEQRRRRGRWDGTVEKNESTGAWASGREKEREKPGLKHAPGAEASSRGLSKPSDLARAVQIRTSPYPARAKALGAPQRFTPAPGSPSPR
jgi:hypothetical protein